MDHPTSSVSSINTSDALHEEPKEYSDFVRVAALAVGIPIIIFGFLGNLMTIIAVIKTKALRTGANIFIISLSVFDLMFVTLALPATIHTIWYNGWVFSKVFYCNIYVLVYYLAIGGNLFNLSGTAFTRYLKIIHPKTFSHMYGRRVYLINTCANYNAWHCRTLGQIWF